MEIQKKLKAPKGQYNSFGKYKYRSCEDILEAVKPLLNGAILKVTDEIKNLGDRYYIKATATISMDGESESACGIAREASAKKGMDEAQITGSASSYARKYALNGLFCIDDNKDVDTKESDIVEDALEEEINKIETVKDLEGYYQKNKSNYTKNISVFNKLISEKKGELINENS